MADKGSRDELNDGLSGAESAPKVARLCYVDDSRTSAYVVRRLLQPYGYQVDYFQSAEPAFVALIQEDYDLLLTDLKVSSKGMDGDDLIRTLRQSGHPKISSMPVIVITGATDARELVNVYDAGANQVMSKPVDAEELDSHIRRLLFEGRPVLKVVDQQHGSDNVVPLSAAQSSSQKQPNITSVNNAFSSDIPVLDAVPPVSVSSTLTSQTTTASESLADNGNQIEPELPENLQAPPELSSAEPEKESLLERAVSKQDKQVNLDAESGKGSADVIETQPDTGALEDDVLESDAPEVNHEEAIIIEPELDKKSHGDNSGFVEDNNILHDMDRHALIIRERTGLLEGLNAGIVGSLIELVGVRGLVKRALWAGVGIFVVLMLWSLLFDKGQPVDTALVETGEIFQSITVPGRVVSKQRINVSTAHTGRIVKILVKESDRVSAGQVLAKLDDRELVSRLNRARANLADAREGIVQAKRTLDRLQKAYKKGAVARRFVEDAEVDLRSVRSKAGIAVENVHSATLELSKQKITAPFSGTITARFTELGQWVGPSESLFTLVDETRREIEVRVDAADSAAIDVGQVVAVSSDAFPGLEWQESVVRLGAAASNDNNANSVKVYISLGGDAPSLRFGQQVDTDIRTAWNPNTLKVPFEALINRGGQTLVAVLEEGQVRLRPVETGIEDFSMVEVKQGLNDGDLVILAKGQFLQNGDKVYPARANN